MLRIQITCNLSYLIVRFLKNYFYKKLLGGISYGTLCVTWTQYYTHTQTHKTPKLSKHTIDLPILKICYT